MRLYSLRSYWVAFVLLLVLPSIALSAGVVWQAVDAYQEAFERGLENTARILALAIEREVGAHEAALEALASSMALDGPEPNLSRFEVEARRASAQLGNSIILLDSSSMQQLVNTALPPGEPAGKVSSADFRAAAEYRQTILSNLVVGAVAQRAVIGVAVPVIRGDQVPFVLAARIEPAALSRLINRAEGLSPKAFAVVVDGSGKVVARSRDHEQFLGKLAPRWYREAVNEQRTGMLFGKSLEGPETVLVYARLAGANPWTVAVSEPHKAYQASWRTPLESLAVGGAAILIGGLILALILARRVIHPISELARGARRFASAEAEDPLLFPSAPPSKIAEIEDVRLGLVAAGEAVRTREAARRHADEQKSIVLAEVDHRAKNALAVALSMIRLAPRNLPPEEFSQLAEKRISALVRTHSLLAKKAWRGADFREAAESELEPYADSMNLSGPELMLKADAVQPVMMILHELASNAAKHGAFSRRGGRVDLTWRLDSKLGTIDIIWTESGGPTPSEPVGRRGFGTRLITGLAEQQLNDSVSWDWRKSGLRVVVALPLPILTGYDGKDESSRRNRGVCQDDPHSDSLPQNVRPRVLVVEDEALLALELRTILNSLDCEVVGPAYSLTEALKLAAVGADRLQAAVLDINLGRDEKVFSVADLLEACGVPFILVSAYKNIAGLDQYAARAVAVLQKPYARDALANAISAALIKRNSSEVNRPRRTVDALKPV